MASPPPDVFEKEGENSSAPGQGLWDVLEPVFPAVGENMMAMQAHALPASRGPAFSSPCALGNSLASPYIWPWVSAPL